MKQNPKIRCVRRVHFCSGHRVMGHENKCATLHGHNYYAEFYAEAPELDSIGRVIDFSVLKEKLGGWIEENWDHTTLIFEKDTEVIEALKKLPGNKPPFICPFNPTAENMAHFLLLEVAQEQLKGSDVQVTKVVIHETANCFAEAILK